MNLAKKLAAIRKMVPAVQKSKKGFGYTYVPLDELQAKVTAAMDKFGVNLFSEVVPGTAKVVPYSYEKIKYSKTGEPIKDIVNEFLYTADTVWHWVNVDNPADELLVPWFAAANMSDASQTVNSANTYQARGFISSFLQLAMTEKDPEDYRSKKRATEDAENQIIAKEIVDSVHAIVTAYIAANPKERDTVSAVIKKRNRGSDNYYNIKDPKVASDLLKEIQDVCKVSMEEGIEKK